MKETKHTPGPWQAIEWSCHARTTVVARIGNTNIVVAECSGHGRHSSESLADAALISAAPDMLKELEECRKELLGSSAYLATCDPAIIVQNLDSFTASLTRRLARVEAVIKKAEGM